jgi:glycosyltransferase involved in cell wall biosynthesis
MAPKMRIAEISDPVSFHTEQWASQLMERGLEPHVVFVKQWIGKALVRTPEYKCKQYILSKPKRLKLLTSTMKRGQFGTLLHEIRNSTSLFSQLEIYGPLLRKYFIENEIDVVHGHQLTGGALLAYASRFKPAIIVAWGSDLVIGPKRYPYLRPLIGKAIEWADVIHTESEVSANVLKKHYPVDDEKIFVSSWGVDTDMFVRNIETEEFRHRYGIDQGPVVLSFRTLESFYRVDIIIRAFSLVLKEHPNATLLVGSDGPEKKNLIELCKSLGIEESVVFTGFLYGAELARAFAISDVYVQCPLSDGVSISGMQAMSAEVPIVANNVGEVAEFVKDGVNGFLIAETDEPGVYAEKISLLLADEGLRKKMGSSSRKMALVKFNRKSFLDKYISLFERLKQQYQR